MKRSKSLPYLGLIVTVIGVALLVYGLVSYREAHSSLENAIGKLFTGSSKLETQAIAEAVVGGVVAAVGISLTLMGRKRR